MHRLTSFENKFNAHLKISLITQHPTNTPDQDAHHALCIAMQMQCTNTCQSSRALCRKVKHYRFGAPPNARGKSPGLSGSAQRLSTTLATPNGTLETIHNIDTLVNRLDPDNFVDKVPSSGGATDGQEQALSRFFEKVPGLEKRGSFGGFWGECALFSSGLAFLRFRSSVKAVPCHITRLWAPLATGLSARQTDPRREAGRSPNG